MEEYLLLLGRLQFDILLSIKIHRLSRGLTNGTCEKELELALKTGFILSTCTGVGLKKQANQKPCGLKNWQHCGRQNLLQRCGCDSQND